MSTFSMGELVPLIEAEAQKQGVDPKLAIAIFTAENTSDGVLKPQKQVSLTTQGITPETGKPSGALGLFQVVPTTLRGLAKTGYIPPTLNYATLPGQIEAGVAAVKEALATSQRVIGKLDPLAAASQYVNGGAGLAGYLGKGPMPAQAAGYLKKISRSLGMAGTGEVESWGRENRTPTPVPTETPTEMPMQAGTPTPMQGATRFSAELPSALAMLQAIGADGAANISSGVAGIKEMAAAEKAAVDAATQRSTAELTRDQNMLALFGLDQGQKSSQLIDELANEAAARQQMAQLKPTVDKLMAVNPFTNPVNWLMAQVQLQSLVPQYNAAVQNRDNAQSQIASKYALAKQAQTMTPAVTVDLLQTEQLAKTKMAEAVAKINSAKMGQENINLRSRLLSEQMQWIGQEVAFNNAAYRTAMEALGIDKDKDAKAAEQAQLDRINKVRTQFGAPELRTWKEFQALPSDQKEALINANPQASSPGEALRNLGTFGDIYALQRQAGNTAMADQALAIKDAAAVEMSKIMVQKPNTKEIDALQTAVNIKYKQWRTEVAGGDITKASSDNPYRISMDQAAKAPALADNEMAKWVQETATKVPGDTLKEKDVLAYAAGRVKNGEDVNAVAQDVANFFSQGYEFQFKARGLGTLGFDARTHNKQIYYGVGSNVFGFAERLFAGAPAVEKPIDLMNPTSVKQFLVESVIKTMQSQQSMRPVITPINAPDSAGSFGRFQPGQGAQ